MIGRRARRQDPTMVIEPWWLYYQMLRLHRLSNFAGDDETLIALRIQTKKFFELPSEQEVQDFFEAMARQHMPPWGLWHLITCESWFDASKMAPINAAVVFIRIANAIKILYESDADWETKYHTIFAQHPLMLSLGITVEWSDPDGSYEDDVNAFYQAVQRKADELCVKLP